MPAFPEGNAAASPLSNRAPVTPGRSRLRRFFAVALPLLAMAVAGVGVGFGALAAHRFITRSPHFRLREIRCAGLGHLTPDEVRARSGISLGDNLFSFSLDDVRSRLRADPWIAAVRVHRELPASLAIEIEERRAAAVVALGSLYLADEHGEVFKRASLDEAAALPVVTGVARDAYVHDREGAQALIREGLVALAAWRARGERAAIGEVHVDAAAGTTLYTREGGAAIALGRGDDRSLRGRLARVDAVWAALLAAGDRPAIIRADGATHPERLAVRLAARRAPSPPQPSGASPSSL